MSTSLTLFGQEETCFPEKPQGKEAYNLVYDQANFLNDAREKTLNKKLVDFAAKTSNQIVVLTVEDLCGLSPNQFSYTIIEEWGVGQKEEDNGVVILIQPKTKDANGEVYIAPGRGLEGAIPDLLAHRIIEEDIVPKFKEGDFVGGINLATDKIMKLAIGEYDEEVDFSSDNGFPKELGFLLLFFIVVILIIVLSSYRKIKNYATLNNITFAEAATLLNKQTISRNGMGGRSGHRSGGGSSWSGGGSSWSGGGSSSGGFGGFGGGSSSGGGAGGSW